MSEWIGSLKQVVLVVFICEFLKELLSDGSFRKYVQFAIRLFLFLFLFCSLFQMEFSLPDFPDFSYEFEAENQLISKYETEIAKKIREELIKNQLSVSEVSVELSDQYEIICVTVVSEEAPSKIQTVLKGEFPYEVVPPTKRILEEEF